MTEPNNGNQNPQNPPSNPPSNPPEGTVTVAELTTLLQNARKEEKDKLYPEINNLKEQLKTSNALVKDVQGQLVQAQQQLKDATQSKDVETLKETIKTLQSELTKLKEDKTVTNPNPQNNPPQPNAELDALKQQIADMQKLLTDTQKQTAEAQAKQLRDSLIAQAQGQLIPEMVVGSTVEEIQASIEASKQAYQKVYQQASASIVNIPPANPVSEMKLPTELDPDQIQNMSMEDWQQWRSKIGLK